MIDRRRALSLLSGLGALGVLAVHSVFAAAQDMPLSQVLIDGEGWKLVAKDFKTPWAVAGDREGNVYVGDPDNNRIDRIDKDGKVATFARLNDVRGLAFGGPASDTLYAVCGDKLFARRTKAKGLVLPDKP